MAIFLPISQVQTYEGGLFSYGGGGLFSIFHRKSASKAQKTCDFASFTSQWGGLEPPPPPPPGYATGSYNSLIKNASKREEASGWKEKFVQMQVTKETVENIDNFKEKFYLSSLPAFPSQGLRGSSSKLSHYTSQSLTISIISF